MYIIRPRKDLVPPQRNLVYRAICNGNLPPDHLNRPGIQADEHDLSVLMDEIIHVFRNKRVRYC